MNLPGEGRDPCPRWPPAFAGVIEHFDGSIGPLSNPAEMAARYGADTSILDWRVTVGMRQPRRSLAEPHTALSATGAPFPLKLRNAVGDGLDQQSASPTRTVGAFFIECAKQTELS